MVEKKSERLGVLRRIHFWVCDRLGVVPTGDFNGLQDDFFELVDICHNFVKRYDRFEYAQKLFDERVAVRLHMDKVSEDLDGVNDGCNFDRGMFV